MMKGVSIILRDLLGMFIDDEFLAVGVLAVVVVVSFFTGINLPPLFSGGLLLVECLAVLTLSVFRGSSTRQR